MGFCRANYTAPAYDPINAPGGGGTTKYPYDFFTYRMKVNGSESLETKKFYIDVRPASTSSSFTWVVLENSEKHHPGNTVYFRIGEEYSHPEFKPADPNLNTKSWAPWRVQLYTEGDPDPEVPLAASVNMEDGGVTAVEMTQAQINTYSISGVAANCELSVQDLKDKPGKLIHPTPKMSSKNLLRP